MFKRAFDFIMAAAVLVILAPLLLAAACAVRVSSPGPILFRQERMGRGFRPFGILKFRSMSVDGPERGGPLTLGTRDPRITPVGRFLRRTKIDELPQLVNILRGEMSWVGPRPEVRKYVELFREDYADLLAVRPGLTDPASLKYRDEESQLGRAADPEVEYVGRILPDKIAISKRYLLVAGWTDDLRVLWKTLLGRSK